jgi:hypothetical protein
MSNRCVEVTLRFDPFYDACIFLIGGTNEHAASGIGWLLVIHCAGCHEYLDRPQELAARPRATQHGASRYVVHVRGDRTIWYQGSIWKLPLPVFGGFPPCRGAIEYGPTSHPRQLASARRLQRDRKLVLIVEDELAF